MKEYRVKVSIRNNLILKAIEDTGCRSVAEFCRNNGLVVTAINSIICMRVPPLNKSGEFSQLAKDLMEVLGACPTDLWAPEQLTLSLGKSTAEREVDFASMRAVLGGNSGFPVIAEMPEESVQNNELKSLVNDVVSTLTKRESDVLKMRYEHDMTLEEIGKTLGVSRDRVRQVEQKALRKLREPKRSQKLKTCRESWTGETKKQTVYRVGYNHETKQPYEYEEEIVVEDWGK